MSQPRQLRRLAPRPTNDEDAVEKSIGPAPRKRAAKAEGSRPYRVPRAGASPAVQNAHSKTQSQDQNLQRDLGDHDLSMSNGLYESDQLHIPQNSHAPFATRLDSYTPTTQGNWNQSHVVTQDAYNDVLGPLEDSVSDAPWLGLRQEDTFGSIDNADSLEFGALLFDFDAAQLGYQSPNTNIPARMESENDEHNPPPKRRRRSRACTGCHKQHQPCVIAFEMGDHYICRRCIQRNEECVWELRVNKRGPIKSQYDSLEERLDDIESKLSQRLTTCEELKLALEGIPPEGQMMNGMESDFEERLARCEKQPDTKHSRSRSV